MVNSGCRGSATLAQLVINLHTLIDQFLTPHGPTREAYDC